MIFELEHLEEIITTSMFTSFISSATPVSIILVAPSGTAKSTLIRRVHAPFIHSTDSFSSQGLWQLAQADPKNEIKAISVPDINLTLSRRPSTVQSAVATLLSLTFDGTARIDDGREIKMCKHDAVSFVSAVTPEIYTLQAKKWFALGLRRRIIPLFYQYSRETVNKLQQAVVDGKLVSKNPSLLKLELIKQRNPLVDRTMALHIRALSEQFAGLLGKNFIKIRKDDRVVKKWYNENIVPISPHLTLRTLAQSHTILRKSAKVEQADIDFLSRFIAFCDQECPKQI